MTAPEMEVDVWTVNVWVEVHMWGTEVRTDPARAPARAELWADDSVCSEVRLAGLWADLGTEVGVWVDLGTTKVGLGVWVDLNMKTTKVGLGGLWVVLNLRTTKVVDLGGLWVVLNLRTTKVVRLGCLWVGLGTEGWSALGTDGTESGAVAELEMRAVPRPKAGDIVGQAGDIVGQAGRDRAGSTGAGASAETRPGAC